MANKSLSNKDFLKVKDKVIRDDFGNGNIVALRGINAGGYLLQELWMTPTQERTKEPHITCEMDIYKTLAIRFGETTMRDLVNIYQDNYWTTTDFDNCQSLGMNCIRLPFWYMNFVDLNQNFLDNPFSRIDWFINQASQRGMYVILTFHGAPGSQNGADHSGYKGSDPELSSEFFFGKNKEKNQNFYLKIWQKIASRYKDEPAVAGYDILNEPFCEYTSKKLHPILFELYNKAYKTIREVDENHIIIMEGIWNPDDLPNPNDYNWTNVMYEYHQYCRSDDDNSKGEQVTQLKEKLNSIKESNFNLPSYMGEFNFFSNLSAWKQGLQILNDFGINWTMWCYKVTGKNNNWGLYNQYEIDECDVLFDSKEEIERKWSNVGNSTPNIELIELIKKFYISSSILIVDGEYYFVAINCNMVVCADNDGNDPLCASRCSCNGAFEAFKLINNDDGSISLKSAANQKFVSVDSENKLVAKSESIGDNEKFTIIKVKNDEFSLKSVANAEFVCTDLDSDKKLFANRKSIQKWEVFNIFSINGNKIIINE